MTVQRTLRTNEQLNLAKALNKELRAKGFGYARTERNGNASRTLFVKYSTINDETKRIERKFSSEFKRLDDELDRKIEEYYKNF